MKIKLIKRPNGTYIRLPEEFKGEEVELFQLKKGYYLLSALLGEIKEEKKEIKKERKKADSGKVLGKLIDIRFQERTVPNLKKEFTKEELEAVEELIKGRKVHIFKSRKYPEGVYSIDNEAFKNIPPKREREKKEGLDYENQLKSRNYTIVESERGARILSEMLAKERRTYSGIKGFDGKYYVMQNRYLKRVGEKILKSMESDESLRDIAQRINEDEEGVLCVLRILNDKGEVKESRKGLFSKV
ncbi:hypothetical protein KAW38_01105 [Candidatus Micrarchaeota archaeon]|nr:hypothetical protein [Candidatus Micrarchaeota archaeon]